MNNQFPQLTRTFNRDGYRLAMIFASLLTLLLIGGYLWLFTSQVTLIEYSTQASVTENGLIEATFSPNALAKIRPEQVAHIKIANSSGEQSNTLSAIVLNTPFNEENTIQLVMTEQTRANTLTNTTMILEVAIEIERVTPATLLRRAAGL